MLYSAKQKRINTLVQVLENNQGSTKTLNMWLTEVNDRLNGRISFINTRQLAQAFKQIKPKFNGNLIRTKFGNGNTCITYYGFNHNVK